MSEADDFMEAEKSWPRSRAELEQRMVAYAEMLATLKDCIEVLDRYSDVDDGHGNVAMQMWGRVKDVVAKVERS